MSMRLGQEVKTPEGLADPYIHNQIFNKFDLEVDHVKENHFTEKDKRTVVDNFM